MTTAIGQRVDRLLNETWRLEAESLAVFRVLYGLYVLLILFPDPTFIHRLPGSWFEPPVGPLLLLESPPSTAVIRVLMVIAAASLVAVIAGWRTRESSLATAVSLMVLYGLQYSYGKIDHTTFVWLVPGIMAFSTWGNVFSLDSRSGRASAKDRGWPVGLLLVALAAAMATAGFAKIRGGWLSFSDSATRSFQLKHVHTDASVTLLAQPGADNHVAVFDEFLDWFAIVFEMAFMVAIWRRSWTRWIVVTACFFHLGVALLLNISFMTSFCVYGLAVAWPAVTKLDEARREAALRGAIGVGAVAAVFAIVGSPFLPLLFEWSDHGDLYLSTIVIAIFSIAAARWAFANLSSPRSALLDA